jgi:S-adenosylmethionine hydrolase
VSRVITLLTDYGLRDSYVAEVKAVLVARAPAATVVDVTHEVPAGDVRAGQYLLARVWHRFPAGSVHLAIVDPGVGTSRRALAAGAAGHLFVAPDNGLLSFLPEDARWVELPVPATAAPTFHGRDVFAPAAARLVNDEHLERLGPTATDVNRFPLPAPRFDGVAWVGEVVYIDRFGTLVTNLPGDAVEPGVRLVVGDRDVGPLRRTFGDVQPGHLVAFVGSGGTIEVAARNGSAVRLLGAGVGTMVRA